MNEVSSCTDLAQLKKEKKKKNECQENAWPQRMSSNHDDIIKKFELEIISLFFVFTQSEVDFAFF